MHLWRRVLRREPGFDLRAVSRRVIGELGLTTRRAKAVLAFGVLEGQAVLTRVGELHDHVADRVEDLSARHRFALLTTALAACELEHVAELRQNLVLPAVSESCRYAAREMTAEELALETLQRALDRVGLLQHVDAIGVFVDHAFDRLDVAFDTREARPELMLLFHLTRPPTITRPVYYPSPGGEGVGVVRGPRRRKGSDPRAPIRTRRTDGTSGRRSRRCGPLCETRRRKPTPSDGDCASRRVAVLLPRRA